MDTKLRFSNNSDELEIQLLDQDQMYTEIRIFVSSFGFSGHKDTWVEGISDFSRGLLALEKARTGEAVLKSVSPGELELKVRAVDRKGHMAVEGLIGKNQIGETGTLYWHAFHFGFEFDPSQLLEAVKISWIKRYASQVR